MANISLLLFDRDGVLNQNPLDNGYVLSPSELIIYPEVLNQIAKLPKEIEIACVTNQQCVGKKLLKPEDLNEINSVIAKSIAQAGGKKLEFFVCPHLATLNCDCRKPKPGLIFQAMSRFSKQPNETLFIGDKETDAMAAEAAKVQFASTDGEVKTKAIINRLLTTKG
jgi:D-glycero-D-manno-heptose 1,7-bisphosphate phosphatase